MDTLLMDTETIVKVSLKMASYDFSRLVGKVLGLEEVEVEFFETVRQLATERVWGDNFPSKDAIHCTLLICLGLLG